jgi:transcriptional regulator with XRE-family HTH domain
MALADPKQLAALLWQGRRALTMSRDEVGTALGWSKRTIGRWESGSTAVYPRALAALARLVYPVDPALAEEMALASGVTLDSLGVETTGPSSPQVLADAIVCAAADAMKTVPETARAGLLAALRRIRQLRVSVDDVERALTARAPTA